MVIVDKRDVFLMEGTNELCVEASVAGLAPGAWPDFIAVLDERDEGFMFGPEKQRLPCGSHRYQCATDEASLLVFNT